MERGRLSMSVNHERSDSTSAPSGDAIEDGNLRASRSVGRRRLVTTGLVAPVIITLGTRAALAHTGGSSSGGSHLASVKKK